VGPALSRIKVFTQEYRVVAFDGRGIGQSDAPDVLYTEEMLADDLAGLLDAIGIDSTHVYGESAGGMLAQYFAVRHANKVRSLVLVSTCCRGRDSSEEVGSFARGEVEKTQERATAVARLVLSEDFAGKNPGVVQRMAEGLMKQPVPARTSILLQQAFWVADICRHLPEIKVPTLVIHGEGDQVIPVENGRLIASRIPHAELETFKSVGHFFIEAPVERDKAVLDFLQRHRNAKKED